MNTAACNNTGISQKNYANRSQTQKVHIISFWNMIFGGSQSYKKINQWLSGACVLGVSKNDYFITFRGFGG